MIQISQATLSDLEKLKELNARIFVENPKFDEDLITDFPFTEEGDGVFRSWIEAKNGCCLVAVDGGEMVGYVNGSQMEVSYRKSRYFEVENLGVVPKMRRKGLGKRLLDEAISWAKSKGYEKVYLNCYAKNIGAIEFYRRMGFGEIDVCLERKI